MERHVITAQGYNGRMSLSADGEWVDIQHTGRLGHPGVDRRVPVGAITEMELQVAGFLRNGHLRLMPAGSSTMPLTRSQVRGDEYTVIFTRRQQPQFEALRDAIIDAQNARDLEE